MASSNWCFSCSILAFLKSAFSLLGWILSTWKAVGRYNSEHRLKKSPQHLTYACQGCIPGSKLHLSLKFNTCYGVVLPTSISIFQISKLKKETCAILLKVFTLSSNSCWISLGRRNLQKYFEPIWHTKLSGWDYPTTCRLAPPCLLLSACHPSTRPLSLEIVRWVKFNVCQLHSI